ncbi:hypothetical protein HanIR_Chr02g0099541 [Helianthus annuus]|nr:hypothetical protein HanIR_Chr02g0099541 [Helianthus annuus]
MKQGSIRIGALFLLCFHFLLVSLVFAKNVVDASHDDDEKLLIGGGKGGGIGGGFGGGGKI